MKTRTKPGRIGAFLKSSAAVLFLVDAAGATALAQGGLAPAAANNGRLVFGIAVASLVFSLFCSTVIGIIAFRKIPRLQEDMESVRGETETLPNVHSKIAKLETHFAQSLSAIESWKAESGRIETHIKGVPGLVKKHMDEKLGVFESLRPKLDQIVGSLKNDLVEVQNLLDRYKSDLKERVADHDRRENDVQRKEASLVNFEQELKKREADLKREKADLEARLRQIDEGRMASDRDLKLAASERTEAAKLREEFQKERVAADAKIHELKEQSEAFDRRVDAFWPAPFLKGGKLASERALLEQRIGDPKSLAALLVNNLQRVYLMAAAAGSYEPQEIARAAQDMSRVAYRYWAETGRDDESQYRDSKLWAEVFQELLGADYKLAVVRVGESKDASYMQYTEGPTRVTKVQTWYVECSSSRLRAHVA